MTFPEELQAGDFYRYHSKGGVDGGTEDVSSVQDRRTGRKEASLATASLSSLSPPT